MTDTKPITVPELDDVAAAFTPRKDSPEPCVLDVVREFIGRFVYATDAELDVMAGWVVHSYVFEAYFATPRLAFLALTEEAGKTTALNMILALAKNPIKTVNASGPSIFKIIEKEHPTLLFDEVDNMWNPKGTGSSKNRDQLGILNEGAYQDGYVLRADGKYPVFVAAAFAGIGQLPKTMASRSIIINMSRVPDNVDLEDYEPDLFRGEAARIREMIGSWLAERGPELDLQPIMPEGLKSRKRQITKVLVAVGDLAGPEWSDRMRKALREVMLGITRVTRMSPAEELIQLVASITQQDTFLPTGELITLLKFQRDHENALRWAEWLDSPFVATRTLANMLKPYGIESQQKWLEGENRRGYHAGDFHMWAQTRHEPETEPAEEEDEEAGQ